MLEDSVSASSSSLTLWESMNSWFTPTILFLLLNLMIGTIALTSSLTNNTNKHKSEANSDPDNPNPKQLLRSPSVLERIKSINFHSHFSKPSSDPDTLFAPDSSSVVESHHSNYFFQNTETTPPAHIFDPPVEEEEQLESMDQVYSKLKGNMRTKSDTKPASGELPVKLPAKMRKSASSKSAFGHFEAEEIVEARRPATVREKKKIAEGDQEVDAKADDFINKFKHQLKLQRLDSIIRYKDMIGRATGAAAATR